MIPGFENAARGMAVGEKKTITIPCAEAYGPHRPELVQAVDRKMIPANIEVQVGLQLQTAGEQPTVVVVTEVAGESVTLDANHPLAGKDLTFEIELVGID